MKRKEIVDHVDFERLYTKVLCKYGCKMELTRIKMFAHEEDDEFHLHVARDATVKLSDDSAKLSVLDANKSVTSEDTCFTFKVNEFQLHRKRVFMSPRFYSSFKGYCLSIGVYPAGYSGDETHVSVDINLCAGDYDDNLRWPFKADVTITLLNQLEDKNNFSKTIPVKAERCERNECPLFIPHSELDINPTKKTQMTLCISV